MSSSNNQSSRSWLPGLLLILGLCIYPFIWGRQTPEEKSELPDPTNRFAYRDWKSIIAPDDEAPESGFTMYRFFTNRPQQITRERVPHIMIDSDSYPLIRHDENKTMPDMYAGDAAAYWLGKIHVRKRGQYRLVVAPRITSGLRVDVDGKTVFNGNGKQRPKKDTDILLSLSAGEHRIEGKYHEEQFVGLGYLRLHLFPVDHERDDNAVRQAIDAQQLPGETVVYVASVNGTEREDRSIIVELPYGNDSPPSILILSSGQAINWRLNGNLPRLIVENHADNTIATVEEQSLPADIPRIHFDGELPQLETRVKLFCLCTSGADSVSYCRDDYGDVIGLPDFAARIQMMTGFPLNGYGYIDWMKKDDDSYLFIRKGKMEALIEQYQKDKAKSDKWCRDNREKR